LHYITKSDSNIQGFPIIAAIDIGTNSIRLLIGTIRNGSLHRIRSERAVTRLGKGLSISGRLNESNTEITIATLQTFKVICDKYDVNDIVAVGTSALREATDSHRFLELAIKETGIGVNIISGETEAALTIKGLLSTHHSAGNRVIADIGGGSTELIMPDNSNSLMSLPIGAVKLFEQFIHSDPPSHYDLSLLHNSIASILNEHTSQFISQKKHGLCDFICTGGTATTLAAIFLKMPSYDGGKVHGVRLTHSAIDNIYKILVSDSLADRLKMIGLEDGRADIIIPGTAILLELMHALDISEVTVSDFGLLEGLIYEQFESA